jgi:hypothetical protein
MGGKGKIGRDSGSDQLFDSCDCPLMTPVSANSIMGFSRSVNAHLYECGTQSAYGANHGRGKQRSISQYRKREKPPHTTQSFEE